MKRRWPSLLLGVAVSVVALVYLFRRDLSGVQSELRNADYVWVLPCLLLSYVGLWLRSLRWRVLLGYRIGRGHSFHILNVSYFINGVLPLRVGELVRAAMAARLAPPLPVFTSLSTIIVERLLDTLAVFALIGVVLTILPVGLEIGFVGMALGIGAVIGVIVLAAFAARPAWAYALLGWLGRIIPPLRRPALKDWLASALEGIRPLASPRTMLLVVGWTAISWAVSVLTGYSLLFAVFDEPTWSASIAMIALASFAIAVPAVPGSLGPFEAAIVFALASTGLVSEPTAAPAVAFALLLHAVNLLTYISAGLVGLWAEGVSLGEVTAAAQGLRARGQGAAPAKTEAGAGTNVSA
jgi:uncharacterized protein (TIRG00374 family)